MSLLDAKGNPIVSSQFSSGSVKRSGSGFGTYAKGAAPVLGEAFAPRWAGDLDKYIFQMPGGGTVMFDLSKLTLADFRTMRDHYQVNACLAVMTFMIHQMDWKIDCDNPKISAMVEENIRLVWTPMIRALSQAFWAGFAPNILQWENAEKYIQLTKVKDLIPEECWINWKTVDGYAPPGFIPPKVRVYDGLRSIGMGWPVPTENSLWYPLLMENGDYFGRKLLRPVFTSWYFSILVHLFSNRYFERFGEPVPVGRASYEEEIQIPIAGGGTKSVLGADLMVQILQNLRNRSVVVLPNDRTLVGSRSGGNAVAYDYDIEYLESQMRGADFERYLMRLDEEISLGLFTPLLILRTADVGSYNLGTTHWNMYLNMLNALVGDMKYYIDNFILSRLVDFNFGKSAPRARINFRKMGDDRKDVAMAMLQALSSGNYVEPDLKQIGEIVGLQIDKVQQLTVPPGAPGVPVVPDPGKKSVPAKKTAPGKKTPVNKIPQKSTPAPPDSSRPPARGPAKKKLEKSSDIMSQMGARISSQINRKKRDEPNATGFEPDFGYAKQLVVALGEDGSLRQAEFANKLLEFASAWVQDVPYDVWKSMNSLHVARTVEGALMSKAGELIDSGW